MPIQTSAENQKVIKNQIISARAEAMRIIREAEEFARDTHQKAIEEAETMREKAYREGTEAALTEFEGNLLAASELRDRTLRETEKDLLRLAVRLAEKIVGREIQKNSKTVVNISTLR